MPMDQSIIFSDKTKDRSLASVTASIDIFQYIKASLDRKYSSKVRSHEKDFEMSAPYMLMSYSNYIHLCTPRRHLLQRLPQRFVPWICFRQGPCLEVWLQPAERFGRSASIRQSMIGEI